MFRKSLSYVLPLILVVPCLLTAQIVNIAPNLAIEDPNGLTFEVKASLSTKPGNTKSRSLNG